MCRWFAYISPEEPCLLSDVLISPANSIARQCSEHFLPKLLPHHDDKDLSHADDRLTRLRNSLLNMDGLGIAWYTKAQNNYIKGVGGARPALYKSASPPFNDFNFRSLCSNTETLCVFAHIRASSGAAVTQVNCHPFVFGRHAFMHNGDVFGFASIRRHLCHLLSYDAYCNVLGSTDSEHAAALYMTYLTEGGPRSSWEAQYPLAKMHGALIRTALTLCELQQRNIDPALRRPNSLNLCTTDGTRMVALRFRNHATQQPPSLYWSEFAGRSLNQKYPGSPDAGDLVNQQAIFGEEERIGRHTIVASEPTTYDEKEWNLIGRNCALTVDEFGQETEIPVRYNDMLDAADPEFDE